jgi:hypothetical protein
MRCLVCRAFVSPGSRFADDLRDGFRAWPRGRAPPSFPLVPAAIPAPAKLPCLAAAGFFVGVGLLIALLALQPYGAAELLGLGACLCAASVFATLPFAVSKRETPAAPAALADPAPLAEAVAQRVLAALAADTAREQQARQAAALAAAPAPLDADEISPLGGARLRLGRGLEGLIRGTSVAARPAPAAATDPSPESES